MKKWWKNKQEPDETTEERQRLEKVFALATEIVRPTLEGLSKQPDAEQRDSVVQLTMALAMAQGIVARMYYKSPPKEFAERIGELIAKTMEDVGELMDKDKEDKHGWTGIKKAAGWDTH